MCPYALTFIKLGGSLITDKRVPNQFRRAEAEGVAAVIADAVRQRPGEAILLGHGSGAFGHVAARAHGTRDGARTPDAWRGFAEVAERAGALNALMLGALLAAGVPAVRFQPSASAQAHDGRLDSMAVEPLRAALAAGLVPLVYGDVAFDRVRGATILSTETLFFYLAGQLPVTRILLLGEVDGVYDAAGTVIPQITPATLADVESALGGSDGTDVTGGMETKVRDMVALVTAIPALEIRIMNGRSPALLADALAGRAHPGTRIYAGG